MPRYAARVLHAWLSTKAEVQKELKPYWSFRDETAIINVIAMKGRRIIVFASLQNSAETAAHKPYGNRRNKTNGTQIHLLNKYEWQHRK